MTEFLPTRGLNHPFLHLRYYTLPLPATPEIKSNVVRYSSIMEVVSIAITNLYFTQHLFLSRNENKTFKYDITFFSVLMYIYKLLININLIYLSPSFIS